MVVMWNRLSEWFWVQLWRAGIWEPSERRVLRAIYAQLRGATLVVGVDWHTRPEHFPEGAESIDCEPERSVYGMKQHRVVKLQDFYPVVPFDNVLMVGLIGYGLNSEHEVAQAIYRAYEITRRGGVLVITANRDCKINVLRFLSESRFYLSRAVEVRGRIRGGSWIWVCKRGGR
jgi:hypothetical protein